MHAKRNIFPLKSYEYLTVRGFSLSKLEKQSLGIKPTRTWDSWAGARSAFAHRMLFPPIPGELSLEILIWMQVWGQPGAHWTPRDCGKCYVSALELSQNCTECEVTWKGLSAEIASAVWNLSAVRDLLAAFKETHCSQLCWPMAGKCGNMRLCNLCFITQSFSSSLLASVATSIISISSSSSSPERWHKDFENMSY